MKIAPLLLISLVLIAGCGGGGDDAKAPAAKQATPAATKSAADAEKDVKAMFDDYLDALTARDWDRACSHLAPETTAKLQANIKQLGVTDPPSDCTELMDKLYTEIDKNAQ